MPYLVLEEIMRHNVDLDDKLSKNIVSYLEENGFTKKQLFTDALKLFIALRKAEEKMAKKHSDKTFISRVVIEPIEEEPHAQKSSVLIY